MVVYNFEDYYTSDKYRKMFDELIEFLTDSQIRLMEYALNMNASRDWQNRDKDQVEGSELQIGPEELADVDDPKVQRLMELYFEMESALEDLRD